MQISGYAGAVFGIHTSTLPNHLTTVEPSWQYANTYIDLPTSKWIVFIYELLAPSLITGLQQWDASGIASAAICCKTTLCDYSTVFSPSSDIIGSVLSIGSLVYPSPYGMLT